MATNLNDLIFIKRVKKAHHEEAHGGAWKIAYADFVTAMMAFFLLMWLLNATTEEQRTAISNYFAPASISKTTSGAGGVLGGRTIDQEGAMSSQMGSPRILLGVATPDIGKGEDETERAEGTEVSEGPVAENEFENADASDLGTVEPTDVENAARERLARAQYSSGPSPDDASSAVPGLYKGGESPQERAARAAAEQLAQEEQERFESAAEGIRKAIAEDPGLSEFKDNLRVEQTAAGLRIQLLDDDERSMFPLGSAELLSHTAELMAKVANSIKDLPNKIAIAGHTDAVPYRASSGYGNWELSTDRAHASRRALTDAGLVDDRIRNVSGKAATDPLIKTDPNAPGNRRISIVLLREAPPPDMYGGFRPAAAPKSEAPAATAPTARLPDLAHVPDRSGISTAAELESTARAAQEVGERRETRDVPEAKDPSDVSDAISAFGEGGNDIEASTLEDASGSDLWQRLN